MPGGLRVKDPRNSLVVPVYGNRDTISPLVEAVEEISDRTDGGLEVIFVVDGSPDDSRERLVGALANRRLQARVVEHSRNFGSFAAIRTGMSLARGEFIAVMAADLQEPPELVIEFLGRLHGGEVDVVAGERASRDDRGDAFSKLYWLLYRRFVLSEIPAGGADVFACTARVRDVICSLEHVHTSLITQLFWVGFRRQLVAYDRRQASGKSGWTLRRKLRYLSDSVFAFTDLPVRMLWLVGILGMVVGVALAIAVVIARAVGAVSVPGYTATILVIIFFGSFNMIGLGIIGSYVWRAYDTVKGRPGAIVRDVLEFPTGDDDG
ncbi:MAG TPA: glycosyltransferase family 2 protein [Solirubrobacterales bacterium]